MLDLKTRLDYAIQLTKVPDSQSLLSAKTQIKSLLGKQPIGEKQLQAALEQFKTKLSPEDFQKLKIYTELEQEGAKSAQVQEMMKQLGSDEEAYERKAQVLREMRLQESEQRRQHTQDLYQASQRHAKEQKLLAFCAMGLAATLPPNQKSDLSVLLKHLQNKAKKLEIPELTEIRNPPHLNQTLQKFLVEGGNPEIAATAILLAQLGVPEAALATSIKLNDLQKFQTRFSHVLSPGGDKTEFSVDPLEKIRQMAELGAE